MLLTSDVTQTNCTKEFNNFRIANSPIAFDILSSRLYSDPILAIIRELLCNAYDAHKAANTLDIPIEVTIPSYLNPSFIIRDYGTGLSPEDVEYLYTTFFGSSKSTDNEFTGGFGLGSKTPFAYTNMFTVTSFYEGKKYVYICTKKNSLPTIANMSISDTDEPNGIRIEIPVDEKDYSMFKMRFLAYISLIPEYNIKSNIKDSLYAKPIFMYNNIALYTRNTATLDDGFYIKQGQNIYKVDTHYSSPFYKNLNVAAKTLINNLIIVYEVPIGTIEITPNREQLDASETSINKINNIINKFNSSIVEITRLNIETFSKSNNYALNQIANSYLNIKYNPEDKYISIRYEYTRMDFIRKAVIIENGEIRETTRIIKSAEPNVIIFTPDFKYKGGIQKIARTINEHNLYKNKTVIVVNTNFTNICALRNCIKAIKNLNNIAEVKYDIETISITKLFRKYPIARAKKGSCITDIGNKNAIAIRQSLIYFVEQSSYRDIYDGTGSRINLKELSQKKNTILLMGSDEEISIIGKILHSMRESMKSAVISKLVNYVCNTDEPTYNLREYGVVYVKECNYKYLSNMPVFSIKTISDFLRNNNIRFSTNTIIINLFNETEKYLTTHLKKKELEYVTKTPFFKMHMFLAKKLNSIDYTNIYTIYDCDSMKDAIKTLPEDIKNNLFIDLSEYNNFNRKIHKIYVEIFGQNIRNDNDKHPDKIMCRNHREFKTKFLNLIRSV